jgi:hypothetical protein
MADTYLPVFNADGQTANIDYRTESTNGHGRQVIVFGDPSVNDNVVPVVTADPGPTSTAPGVVVRLAGSAQVQIAGSTGSLAVYFDRANPNVIANAGTGTFTVQLDPGYELGSIKSINSSVAVYFDRGNPTVTANAGTGSFNVQLDPGHELGSVRGINSSVAVYFDRANPTVTANAGTGTFNVQFDPGHELGSIKNINSSVAVYFDRANPNVIANAGTGSFTVQFDPGHELGSIKGINNSINVYLGATAGTIGVRVGQIDGSVAVYFSPASPTVLANNQHTASIFTVSGSTSGVSASGVTLVSPSANASFKVFAFSLQTTGIVSVVARFTNGGGSATEYWRGLVTSNQTASTPVGANLAVPPPSYLFATGTSTTLALHLDTSTLVHYSVSYIKESA